MTTPATTSISPDPFAALGITPEATEEEIKKAYFAQVRANPPERAPDAFKKIRAAYEQLNSPERKLEATMMLIEAWPESEPVAVEPIDLSVNAGDIILAARALSDVGRTDWREDFREIKL